MFGKALYIRTCQFECFENRIESSGQTRKIVTQFLDRFGLAHKLKSFKTYADPFELL